MSKELRLDVKTKWIISSKKTRIINERKGDSFVEFFKKVQSMHKRYSIIRVKINCDNEFKFSNLGNRHG